MLIRTKELPSESHFGAWLLLSVLAHAALVLTLALGWWDQWRESTEETYAPVQLIIEEPEPAPPPPVARQPMTPAIRPSPQPVVQATPGPPRVRVTSSQPQPIPTAPVQNFSAPPAAPPVSEPHPTPATPSRARRPAVAAPGEGQEAVGPALVGNGSVPAAGGSAPAPGSGTTTAEAPATVAAAPAPPALKESGASEPRETGPAVAPVTCLRCPQPPYPAHLRQQGIEGRVALTIDVGPDGRVTAVSLRQSSGSPQLDEVAIQSVWRWQFTASPQGRQGMNVAVRFQLR
ncbi:MAG: TonB family protein [Gloeomargarita sp. SKYBB_i_bin120]|nr:TonB family protein [Gloeomargarita sp. SKYB120]MDW8178080.1 TonB family protein [Gloeomargarita sp. SKYBB_i_bin120]